jgi:hypothetical protein
MFIKVFVPNANGKIELSVQELEALLKDAADKAVREKCANCNRSYYGGITYLNTNATGIDSAPKLDSYKVTCNDNGAITLGSSDCSKYTNKVGGVTLMDTINRAIGE